MKDIRMLRFFAVVALLLAAAHLMNGRESIGGGFAGLEGPHLGMVEHGEISVDGEVMDRMFVMDQMVEGNPQSPDCIFRPRRPGILCRDIFVLDFGVETILQGFPILSTESGPHAFDGLEVFFSGHRFPLSWQDQV